MRVGEHGRARVSEGEGGEDFYIAQTGKPADLHVSGGRRISRCQVLLGNWSFAMGKIEFA